MYSVVLLKFGRINIAFNENISGTHFLLNIHTLLNFVIVASFNCGFLSTLECNNYWVAVKFGTNFKIKVKRFLQNKSKFCGILIDNKLYILSHIHSIYYVLLSLHMSFLFLFPKMKLGRLVINFKATFHWSKNWCSFWVISDITVRLFCGGMVWF